MITASFLKNFQRRKLEGATWTNGLLLQKETAPKINQSLIDLTNNNLYLERIQGNCLFFKKMMSSKLPAKSVGTFRQLNRAFEICRICFDD
jgi:hypothetical protein